MDTVSIHILPDGYQTQVRANKSISSLQLLGLQCTQYSGISNVRCILFKFEHGLSSASSAPSGSRFPKCIYVRVHSIVSIRYSTSLSTLIYCQQGLAISNIRFVISPQELSTFLMYHTLYIAIGVAADSPT